MPPRNAAPVAGVVTPAMIRGKEIHTMIQHGSLCNNGCTCPNGPPFNLSSANMLICQYALNFINNKRWTPLSAEVLMDGGIRPDLVLRRQDGGIVIIEIKTGYAHIMQPDKVITQRKHLKQLCSYGVEWNLSSFKEKYGECKELLLYYPDARFKPWINVDQKYWEVFAPPKPKKRGHLSKDENENEEDGGEDITEEPPRRRTRKNPNMPRVVRSGGVVMSEAMAKRLGAGKYSGEDVRLGRALYG